MQNEQHNNIMVDARYAPNPEWCKGQEVMVDSRYATKEDLNEMKEDIKDIKKTVQNIEQRFGGVQTLQCPLHWETTKRNSGDISELQKEVKKIQKTIWKSCGAAMVVGMIITQLLFPIIVNVVSEHSTAKAATVSTDTTTNTIGGNLQTNLLNALSLKAYR